MVFTIFDVKVVKTGLDPTVLYNSEPLDGIEKGDVALRQQLLWFCLYTLIECPDKNLPEQQIVHGIESGIAA